MRIIFSRKGCDAGTGGIPSPILPSGELYSLPIPERHPSGITYGDLQWGNLDWGPRSQGTVGDLVQTLSRDRLSATSPIHLDPDLARSTVAERSPDWMPAFGQLGAAAQHLNNRGVTQGDLFLFFGWFRSVIVNHGRYAYAPRSPDQHLLFGWLQVQDCLKVTDEVLLPAGLARHPHRILQSTRGLNHIYIARDRLQLPGHRLNVPGAGYIQRLNPALILTATGRSRCWWQVPDWMHPHGRASTLSYHNRRDRWVQTDNGLLLKTVGRGQEFVLDCDDYPEAIAWVAARLASCAEQGDCPEQHP